MEKIKKLFSDVKFKYESDHAQLRNLQEQSKDIFGVYVEQNQVLKREITMPPLSNVSVTVFSDRIIGRIPFEAVYKVVPEIKDSITAELINHDVGDGVEIVETKIRRNSCNIQRDDVHRFREVMSRCREIKSKPLGGP